MVKSLVWISNCPCVGLYSSLLATVSQRLQTLVNHQVGQHSRCRSHCSRKIQCRACTLLYHVSLPLTICGHYEPLKIQCRKLMINTSIFRILHRQHPSQVIQCLRSQVSNPFSMVGYIQVQIHRTVHLAGQQHCVHCYRTIYNIFIVITRIIPSARHRQFCPLWPTSRCCCRMYLYLCVWVTSCARPSPSMLLIYCHRGSVVIERTAYLSQSLSVWC